MSKYRSAQILVGAIASSVVFLPIAAQAAIFNFTGSIDTFTVSTTGVYRIDAFGAQGGNGFLGFGGFGGEIGGDFNLTAGEILSILVGGVGKTGFDSGNDGGGGTFVVLNSLPLVIAGGGGGSGNNGFSSGSGGGGGGGFSSNGSQGEGGGGGGNFGGIGGFGGSGNSFNFSGGGDGSSSLVDGGSGTLVGDVSNGDGFGGSGGYDATRLASLDSLVTSDGVNLGDGRVTIDLISSTAVPEPLTIIGTIIGGTAAMRMRKKLKSTIND